MQNYLPLKEIVLHFILYVFSHRMRYSRSFLLIRAISDIATKNSISTMAIAAISDVLEYTIVIQRILGFVLVQLARKLALIRVKSETVILLWRYGHVTIFTGQLFALCNRIVITGYILLEMFHSIAQLDLFPMCNKCKVTLLKSSPLISSLF